MAVVSTFCNERVVAQEMYDWIRNGGFEDGTGEELIVNGDVEQGDSIGWDVGGSTVSISSVESRSPTHSVLQSASMGANGHAHYNMTENVSVSTMVDCGFWLMGGSSIYDQSIRVTYTDNDYDDWDYTGLGNGSWLYMDVFNNMSWAEGKDIWFFTFSFSGSTTSSWKNYIDDFSMKSALIGQTEITSKTSPWYDCDLDDSDFNQQINTTFGRYSGACYGDKFGEEDTGFFESWTNIVPNFGYDIYVEGMITGLPVFVIQDIGYLPSNNVDELSLWVYCTGEGAQSIMVTLIYGDGSYNRAEKQFASFEQWTKLDFTSDVRSNKYIIQVMFLLSGGDGYQTGSWVYVDDISMISDIPVGQSGFEWVATPEPITYDYNSFVQYYGVAEKFYCSVYDVDGEKTENGTYTVDTEIDYKSGSIVNGEFQFQLIKRSNSVNHTELLTVQIDVENRSLVIVIYATWWVYSGDGLPPIDGNGDGGGTDWASMPSYLQFMMYFSVFGLPALALGAYGSQSKPSWGIQGFIGGGCLSIGVGVLLEMIDFWFVTLFFLLLVFMLITWKRA